MRAPAIQSPAVALRTFALGGTTFELRAAWRTFFGSMRCCLGTRFWFALAT